MYLMLVMTRVSELLCLSITHTLTLKANFLTQACASIIHFTYRVEEVSGEHVRATGIDFLDHNVLAKEHRKYHPIHTISNVGLKIISTTRNFQYDPWRENAVASRCQVVDHQMSTSQRPRCLHKRLAHSFDHTTN